MTIRLIPDFSTQSARPGRCYIYGESPRRSNPRDRKSPLEPVVDLDTHIRMEGNLEIGFRAAQDIASAIGWLPPERIHTLEDESLALLDRAERAEERAANLTLILETLEKLA